MQEKVLEEIRKRIQESEKYSNIAVIYDFDVDGCCSAALLWRFLTSANTNATFYPNTRSFQSITIERIKKQNPDKIIVVDHVPDDDLTAVLKNYNTTVLDHHRHEKHLEVLDYITVADYGTSHSMGYFVYNALKHKLRDSEWLAKLSLFWDKGLEGTEFYEEDIYKNELEKYLPFNLVVCLTQVKGSEKILEILNQSTSLDEALEKVNVLEDYKRAKKIFGDELQEITFSKRTFQDIKLNIYWVKTQFKHMRVYVDYITYSKEGTNVFIINEITQFKFSFRSSFEVDLVKMLRSLNEKFKNFSGGGHSKACGAVLRGEQVEEVLDEFINIYSEEFSKLKV